MVGKISKLVVLNQEDLVLRDIKFSKNKWWSSVNRKKKDNPFEITESDVEDAQFADNIIYDDEEDDADIDWKTNQNHKKSSSVDSFVKFCV